ncbi:unnamed protein product [Urochloa humidicola]
MSDARSTRQHISARRPLAARPSEFGLACFCRRHARAPCALGAEQPTPGPRSACRVPRSSSDAHHAPCADATPASRWIRASADDPAPPATTLHLRVAPPVKPERKRKGNES